MRPCSVSSCHIFETSVIVVVKSSELKSNGFAREKIWNLKKWMIYFVWLVGIIMQSRRVFTTTTFITRNVYVVTPAVSTWRVPVRSVPVASRIKSFATCISPTWLWWSHPISCNNSEASSLNRSAVPLPDARAAPHSSFHFRLKPVQVFIKQFLYFYSHYTRWTCWCRTSFFMILT